MFSVPSVANRGSGCAGRAEDIAGLSAFESGFAFFSLCADAFEEVVGGEGEEQLVDVHVHDGLIEGG